MIAAFARDHAAASGRRARELHRRLDRFGAARREQRHRERLARGAGERLGQLGGVRRWRRVAEAQRLGVEQLVQPRHEARVVVADVHAAEAGQEIEIPAAAIVPHIDILGAIEHPSVAEDAEQLHERRIDVTRVALDGVHHTVRFVRLISASICSAAMNVTSPKPRSMTKYGG